MYAPPCSCRTGTKETDERDGDWLKSSVSSPGMPNTYSTPSASRQSTKTSDARRKVMCPQHFKSTKRARRHVRYVTFVYATTRHRCHDCRSFGKIGRDFVSAETCRSIRPSPNGR